LDGKHGSFQLAVHHPRETIVMRMV